MSSHADCLEADSREAILPNFRQFLGCCLGELFDRWNQHVVQRSKNFLKSSGTK